MTTRSNNTNSGSAPQLGRNTGNPPGGANLRAAQTLAVRVRWNTTANGYDQIALAYYANGAFDGIYLGRRTSATGNVVNAWRSNAAYSAWNIASSTAAGYANTTDWVHLCATYDATTLRLYVDGVANGSIASAATFTTSVTNTNLATAWGGLFDQCDAMLFSRVLTDAEILNLARKRGLASANRGDCFLWAPMTQSSSIANLGRDFSGRGNHLAAITGTGTAPIVSNISVPFTWGARNPRPFYVPVIPAVATGGVVRSGASSATGRAAGAGDIRSGTSAASAIAAGAGDIRSGASIASALAAGNGDVRSGSSSALGAASGGNVRSGAAAASGQTALGGVVRSGSGAALASGRGGVVRSGDASLGLQAVGGDVRSGSAAASVAATAGGVVRSGAATSGASATGGVIRSGVSNASTRATGGVVRGGTATRSGGGGGSQYSLSGFVPNYDAGRTRRGQQGRRGRDGSNV